MADKKEVENKTVKTAKFSKDELVNSNKFVDYVDVLNAILEDEKTYTIEETENIIDKFLKGKVD